MMRVVKNNEDEMTYFFFLEYTGAILLAIFGNILPLSSFFWSNILIRYALHHVNCDECGFCCLVIRGGKQYFSYFFSSMFSIFFLQAKPLNKVISEK